MRKPEIAVPVVISIVWFSAKQQLAAESGGSYLVKYISLTFFSIKCLCSQ